MTERHNHMAPVVERRPQRKRELDHRQLFHVSFTTKDKLGATVHVTERIQAASGTHDTTIITRGFVKPDHLSWQVLQPVVLGAVADTQSESWLSDVYGCLGGVKVTDIALNIDQRANKQGPVRRYIRARIERDIVNAERFDQISAHLDPADAYTQRYGMTAARFIDIPFSAIPQGGPTIEYKEKA